MTAAGRPRREVPAFDIHELRERATRYCVCIPIINEGERIHAELREMAPLAGQADIIIADGGSSDGSTDPELLRSLGVRSLLVKTGPGRLGAQIRMAFSYALDQGYAGAILIDGNNKDDPAAIPRFIQALEEGYDFVQGSRFVPGGRALHNPRLRLAAIRLLHAPLISLSARHRYTDTTNGFRAYSARLIEDERVAVFRDVLSGYELHYYLAIRAARLGYRVTEVPVTRRYPAHGPIPTKISFLRGNAGVLLALGRACLHRYDP